MKKISFISSCLLIALFLIQFSTAIAEWTDFGFSTRTTQAQSPIFNSQFGNSAVTTSTMTNGLSTHNTNIPYQALIPTIDINGNYLVLSNGNYLQVYDKDLNLVTEKVTGSCQGQLSTLNYIGEFSNNEQIVGLWRPNQTILSFRAYNFTGVLSTLFESNYSTTYEVTSNGVKCFNSLGYGECYAFIDEYNSTDYFHSLLIISYNSFNNTADFTKYPISVSRTKIYEPPAWIDWDYDGTLEFLGFTNNRIYVIDYNGNLELNYTAYSYLTTAKFIKTDAGNYKIILSENNPTINPPCPALSYNCVRYRAIRTDGTTLWDFGVGSTNSGDVMFNSGLAIADYDGDNYDDIWVVNTRTGSNLLTNFVVYKGSDASTLYSQPSTTAFSGQSVYPAFMLTLAKMGNDDTYDFVSARNGYSYIWETENQSLIFRENIGAISCIPADLDYDGLTDVICTYPTGTKVYSADYTNLNAYIYSVSFSPSAVIEVNSTLTATVTAIDPEDDSIYYSIRCNNTGSYSTETDNPIQTCYYNTLGNYEVTIRVRDEFHGTYDTLTQDIEVALTSYTQAEGGVAIPTKLVDVDDTEQGLLPSIYYGTLGFFSNILSPLFIIVVLFLSMAIIITIIGIAVKLIHKASSIG